MSDKLKKIFETDDQGLLHTPSRAKSQTPSDRLEYSFIEINNFYSEQGRVPDSRTADLSERKLAKRLLSIKTDDEKVGLLQHLDLYNLLAPEKPPENINEVFNDDELGLFDDPTGILTIKNVPQDVVKPDFIARPHPSKEFAQFEPGFVDAHQKLKNGEFIRERISSEYQIASGRYYVLKGILVYVADMADKFESKAKKNARLRLIYENGTESNILLRSFARELYRNGQRILPSDYMDRKEWQDIDEADSQDGYVYILKSLSDKDEIKDIKNLYKIGFSRGSVEERIKSAQLDPTYLMAPVEIVEVYKCYNLNPQKLERIIHRVFDETKLGIEIADLNGRKYLPSEWYVAPIDVINKVVNYVLNGEIVNFVYDANIHDLIELKNNS